ncbi:hypothetical protein Prudu_014054 [Prunus dulcis]|uniref:Uncharacterized protein n=1 Tax=Prunus dulcis TaxID=3755 RepID=A0A4Y1RHU8_PRUDU|nr:hypothetical protein Prudu_014054 [Prunus dulcis]
MSLFLIIQRSPHCAESEWDWLSAMCSSTRQCAINKWKRCDQPRNPREKMHCELGNQKLVITVLPSSSSSAPSSSPSSWPSAMAGPGPSTSAATTVGTRFALIMLLTIGFLWMLMA